MTGQAVARVNGMSPDVPVSAGRKGFKAELDGLRERMRGLGFSFDEIAAELARRYRVRRGRLTGLRMGGRWSMRQRGSTRTLPGKARTQRRVRA